MGKREILIDEETIQERVRQLALQISNDYDGRELTIICILRGSMYFFTDLTRQLTLDVNLEFMRVSSYIGENSTGEIDIKLDIEGSIEGKDVLIVEDIVDTGKTMTFLLDHLSQKKPNSIKICTMLDKPERRSEKDIHVDYVGFVIPNRFVIGYGLDLDGKYRNLRDINCITGENDPDLEKDVSNIRNQVKRKSLLS